jgi:heme exporter protein CcmD
MSLSQFVSMGGYSLYVWPAYFITLLVFGINIFFTLNEKKHIKKLIKHYFLQTQKHHE